MPIVGCDCKWCSLEAATAHPVIDKPKMGKPDTYSLSYGDGVLRTQKALGIRVLKNWGFGVPSYNIHRIENVTPEDLINTFARPCPVRPRHGFVESRMIRTKAEAIKIIDETKKADPKAEIVTMTPLLDAVVSAIWTKGAYIIGPGHDGATSGVDCLTLPAVGDIVKPYTYSDAGITDSPYVEIVYSEGRTYYVQLRDGPRIQALNPDYIPAEVVVKRVLKAEGDLLEWETKMKNAEEGTVVWHPDGSLGSHYAVHGILNKVPVVTSMKPNVGDVLAPNTAAEPEIDIQEMKYGFKLGAGLDMKYASAVDLMLTSCHHAGVWKGRFDRLIGLGMGAAYRLTVAAALGEYRHWSSGPLSAYSRDQIYADSWEDVLSTKYLDMFHGSLRSFRNDKWRSGFGGKSWFDACVLALELYVAVQEGDGAQAISSLNNLVNAGHNNGWLFNKFASNSRMDQAAGCPAKILVEAGPMFYGVWKTKKESVKLRDYSKVLAELQAPKSWIDEEGIYTISPSAGILSLKKKMPPVDMKKINAIQAAPYKAEGCWIHMQFKTEPGPYYYKINMQVPSKVYDNIRLQQAKLEAAYSGMKKFSSYAGDSDKKYVPLKYNEGCVFFGAEHIACEFKLKDNAKGWNEE